METVINVTSKLEVEQVVDADHETCCTFIMHGEDHTLGNALRYIISKNPEVEFCGYSIPHPAENKLNLRIQTRGEIIILYVYKIVYEVEDLAPLEQRNLVKAVRERVKRNPICVSISTGVSATEVLRKGLEALNDVCDHVLTTFEGAAADFKSNSENGGIDQ